MHHRFYHNLVTGLSLLTLAAGCTQEPEVWTPDPAQVAAVHSEVKRAAADKTAYRAALNSNDLAAYETYLEDYPEGAFRLEAQRHRDNLGNRSVQARFAYEETMRTLRETSVPRRVTHKMFGSFRPSINNLITQIDNNLSEELRRQQTQQQPQLPDSYLRYVDDFLRALEPYTNQLAGQLASPRAATREIREGIVLNTPFRKMKVEHPFAPQARDYLDRCGTAVRKTENNLRKKSEAARKNLEKFRVD